MAHPPGYPLFTWLGHIATVFTHEPAQATNLLTALLAALACGVLHLAGRALGISRIGAAVAALTLAFSATFWQQSVVHEVYSFTILLLSLLLWTLSGFTAARPRLLLLAGYLFGLALAHQPTALLWLPALLIILFTRPDRPSIGPLVLPTFLTALLGASTALGTLFLAQSRPLLNWGDPSTFSRFLAHITAGQYRGLAFTSLVWHRLIELPRLLVSEFGVPSLLTMAAGLVWLFWRDRPLLLAIALLSASASFALGYQTIDYTVQLLPSFLALAMAAGAAANLLEELFRFRFPFISVLLLAAPGYALFAHYPAAAELRLPVVRELGENLLNSLPENAILLTSDDCSRNSVLYLQQVHGLRPDIRTVHAEMLFSPVYRSELRSFLPLAATPLLPGSATTRGQRRQFLLAELVRAVPLDRPVCLTTDILDPDFFAGPVIRTRQPLPTGIVVRLIPRDTSVLKEDVAALNRRLWSSYRLTGLFQPLRNPALAAIANFYPSALNNLAAFCHQQGWNELALASLNQALRYPMPDWLRSLILRHLETVRAAT